jgi:hypothetical protein
MRSLVVEPSDEVWEQLREVVWVTKFERTRDLNLFGKPSHEREGESRGG